MFLNQNHLIISNENLNLLISLDDFVHEFFGFPLIRPAFLGS